jgi:hypothetical protein
MRRGVLIVGVALLALAAIVIGVLLVREAGETEALATTEAVEESEASPDEPVAGPTPLASPTPPPTPAPAAPDDQSVLSIDERMAQLEDALAQTATAVAAAPAPSPSQPAESLPAAVQGAVSAAIADPLYLADGRWAEVYITVTNLSVSPFLRTGYDYVQPNPDGAHQRVTLLIADQQEVPQPILGGEALWLGHTRFSDGTWWTFPVGCLYIEDVFAEGMEGDFHWEAHYTGGFFDCGNSTDKIVPPIAPGETATMPLYVYLQHPRLWLTDPPPTRSISQIDLEVFDANGSSLGIVASRHFGS